MSTTVETGTVLCLERHGVSVTYMSHSTGVTLGQNQAKITLSETGLRLFQWDTFWLIYQFIKDKVSGVSHPARIWPDSGHVWDG